MTDVAKYVIPPQLARGRAPRLVELDDSLFSDWRDLLERRVGLYIAADRRSFLAAGLRNRMRETGCKSYGDYYEYLLDGPPRAEEWSLLIDTLTVHETRFFRHDSSMRCVVERVMPDVFERHDSFSAWSVGCATGEETYSLAMLLDDYCSTRGEKSSFGVTGTDISLPALKQAKSGIYAVRGMRHIEKPFQDRYCKCISHRHFQIRHRVRKRVCFAALNLRDLKRSPFSGFDLIFCQNLMIYFDRGCRHTIANSLAERLRPGGFLIFGPGEVLGWQHPDMEKMRYDDTLAYRHMVGVTVMRQERT